MDTSFTNYKRVKSKQNNVGGRRMDTEICGIW